jgi:outer membrane protein OmpA-like peptidoglycan-associated protein
VDIKNGKYGKPKNLGSIVNTKRNERFPFINSEGSLFFASDGHPGLGLLDIFGTVSDKNNNILSIINLGTPVNSSKDDFSFFMNEDGMSGYFASNRNGGTGSDDIYAFNRIPELMLQGTVYDKINNTPVPNAMVNLLDTNGDTIKTIKTNGNGQYSIYIDREANYIAKVTKPDFEDNTHRITSKGLDRTIKNITSDFSMDIKADEDETIPLLSELKPIYYDYNSSKIRHEAALKLDKIVDLMLYTYPKMTIKIESYSDSRGSASYNYKLSEKRAHTAYKYLVDKGVSPSQITAYKGYGEAKLANDCDDSIRCSEAQHQLNRRTQIIVVKMK